MYISTNIEPFKKWGDIKSVLQGMKQAGFDAYDYSMYGGCENTNVLHCDDWKERAQNIRKLADEIGIACNQSHAPFPTWKIGEEAYNAKTFVDIERAIEITGILGGKVCVVHPCNDASAEENATFYNRLLPTAKRCNVKIGVENMWNWENGMASKAACSHHEDFARHLAPLDKEWFVANVDIGHSQMQGLNTSALDMIYALKDRLHALHIHDTDCYHDNHAIPFTMQIDFTAICKALREVGYDGDVTLEVGFKPSVPVEMYPQMAAYMAQGAAYMRRLIKE